MDTNHLKILFYQGNFQEFLDHYPKGKTDSNTLFSYKVGSLCFLGKFKKAEILFKNRYHELKIDQLIESRFFLAITSTRLSKHNLALKLLKENLLLSKNKSISPSSLFFIHQGLAFYRFQQSSLRAAKRSIDLAYEYSVLSGDIWQQVLALDLKGYVHNTLGRKAIGLACLEDALQGALGLGNGGIAQTLSVSICCLKAESGVYGSQAITKIEEKLSKLSSITSYSQISLRLELSRQLSLVGAVRNSIRVLSEMRELVLGSHHKRFIATWYLRNAYNDYLTGELQHALELLKYAHKNVDSKVDRTLEISILGFQDDILQQLSSTDKHLKQLIRSKTLQSQSGKAQRVLRRKNTPQDLKLFHDDPLGNLLDEIYSSSTQSVRIVQSILDSGYYSLLRHVIGLELVSSCLYFDLIPGFLFCFDRGNVEVFNIGRSSAVRYIFRLLMSGPKSKAKIVEQVWGYRYVPYRHDHLIYGLISRFKQSVGGHAWLESSEDGYRLARNFKIIFHQHLEHWPSEKLKLELTNSQISDSLTTNIMKDLNYRQILILEHFSQDRFISSVKVMSLCGVSKITAVRDLKRLEELKLVQKIGQGRATRYSLAQAH